MTETPKIATRQSYGEALKELGEAHPDVVVLNAARECGRIVTCEEHSVIGGPGEAVCTVIARHEIACPVERVGINDEFGHSGSAGELLKQFGLCVGHIAKAAHGFIR